jgi:aspartate/methionine/tyrosine aminotransferase
MSESPVAARLRADDLARSPIRTIMELADRDNIAAVGLNPDEVISFAGGWVNHAAPEAMRRAYEEIARDTARFHASGAYSPTTGLASLRQALVRLERERYGTAGLSVDNVIVGQSSTQLTYCLFTALLDAGDTVLLLDPAYANYAPQLAVLSDRIDVRTVPVLDPATFRYFGDSAVRRIEEALARHRPKLLLFSSPDNPTGQLVPDDAFDRVIAAAASAGCTVAVDLAYREQYFSEQRPRHFSASPMHHDNLVALHSNSKWCRGLGRRLGWAVARPEIIEALALVQQSVILCPDTFHQQALARYLDGALEDGSLATYLEASRALYATAARRLSECIEEHLKMSYLSPQGGLYTVVDVGRDADAFVREVLRATGVIFVPGAGFGATLERAVRVSFGPLVHDLPRMDEGFRRVRAHLGGPSG